MLCIVRKFDSKHQISWGQGISITCQRGGQHSTTLERLKVNSGALCGLESRVSGQVFEQFLDQYVQYKVKRSLVRAESLWRRGKSGLREASKWMLPYLLMAYEQRDIPLLPTDVKTGRNKRIFLNRHPFLARSMTFLMQ